MVAGATPSGKSQENTLAEPAIGDRNVRKADGGRRPKAIREIPVDVGDPVGAPVPCDDEVMESAAMDSEAWVLLGMAVSTAFVHTVIGPDHYLPFIMMSRARAWSKARTLAVTLLCGVGHVLSSVLLGLIGVAAGTALASLEAFEGFRGQIAAWGLIAFGLVYMLWGLWRIKTGRTHTHRHMHDTDGVHEHEHTHANEHTHVHDSPAAKANITPWVLFVIFAFGPCEVLIPQLMYPAAKSNWSVLLLVTGAFSVVTIATMTAVVMAGVFGLRRLRLGFAERYAHVLAGGVIAASGLAIQVLGL